VVCIATCLDAGTGTPPAAAAASKPLPRFTFASAPGSSVLVEGSYPVVPSPCALSVQPLLRARYDGTVEVGKDTAGKLFIVAELPFEDYLKGIAEMPRTWPMNALEAQAVAARSYALAHMSYPDPTGDELGYDLCATDACQVYRGLSVADGPYGDRWREAVNRTKGQVLLSQGRPADALYFSTSNGHTFGNEQVFGTDPLPYLRPVTENDDGASPVSHWRASLRFSDVATFLGRAGSWPSGTKVTGVRRDGPNVVVTGAKTSRTIDVVSFRSDINGWAHCLDPGRYPQVDTDGSLLPQTVPSRWFGTSTSGDSVVLTGRGWGHGVGMVQWGAYGKALRGASYRDILADYYGGLRPQPDPAEPPTIRIGIATGLSSVRIAGTGDVTIRGRDVPGPWLVTGGHRLRVVHAQAPKPLIQAGTVSGPTIAPVGRTRHATVVLPQTSVVTLVLRRNGADTVAASSRTLAEGATRLAWKVPDVPSGTYVLQSVVTDGTDIVRATAGDVSVTGGTLVAVAPTPTPSPTPQASSAPAPSPTPETGHTGFGSLALMVLAAVAVAGVSLWYLSRRWRNQPGSQPPPTDAPFDLSRLDPRGGDGDEPAGPGP
jgi:stage II sporulation protein D